MCDSFSYCPICQLPLKAISISPDVHVSQCLTRSVDSDVLECVSGVHCLSTDVFHYRDFSHKQLAAYRSSADFVPPADDIRPPPLKRRTPIKMSRKSPRKRPTPTKPSKNSERPKRFNEPTNDSDSESDFLIPAKKPRRNLKFCETNGHEKNGVDVTLKRKTVGRPRKKADNYSKSPDLFSPIKKETRQSVPDNSDDEVVSSPENLKETCDNVSKGSNFSQQEDIPLSKTIEKLNKKLNEGREISFTGMRSQSLFSSMSSKDEGSQESDLETASAGIRAKVEADSEDNDSTNDDARKESDETSTEEIMDDSLAKVMSIDTNDDASADFKRDFVLKEAVLSLPRLKVNAYMLPSLSQTGRESEASRKFGTETLAILPKTDVGEPDFDDAIQGSRLDKELLGRKLTSSPVTPSESARSAATASEYNISEASVSDASNSSTSFVGKTRTKNQQTGHKNLSGAYLTSSSDSEVPLAAVLSSSESDVPLASLVSKRTPRSKKNGKLLGNEKAGKVLRITKGPVAYSNGFPLKSDPKSEFTDKDSDSGQSSGSKASWFVPSDRNSSSKESSSDSAFSAETSGQLRSSATSTETSSASEESKRSDDPSFSEDSRTVRSACKRCRESPVSSKRKRQAKVSSQSDTGSSSEISAREKLLFKQKSPLTMKNVKAIEKTASVPRIRLFNGDESDGKSEWQSLINKMRDRSFPSDLKIDSEDSLTVASSCSSSDTSRNSALLPARQCPFYKRIPDTPFAVDAFQYWDIPGVKSYFLSHFHSDHYVGLKRSFSRPIYCTQITASLVRMKLRVEDRWLRVLRVNEPTIICGVEVTALDANHCPGSVMFLFALTTGRNYLHVGDFRADKSMMLHPALRSVSVDKLFLDTTYCSPQYSFPTQEEVISRVVDIVRAHASSHPGTLVVCGSYTIGKEKVFMGVAEALDWRVWARPEKQRVFTCLSDPRISSRLVRDPRAANVHVLPMASIQHRSLQQHVESCAGSFTHVLAFKPTGWELNSRTSQFKVTSYDNITIYGVPYSEHSSFTELRDFVQFLQPHEVIPTVNVGSAASRAKMTKHFSDWLRPQTSNATDTQTKVSNYFKKSVLG